MPNLVLQPGTIGWSVEDLENPDVYSFWAEGRYEIYDGVLVEMPASQFHGGAVAINLIRAPDPHLIGRQVRPLFAPEANVQVLPGRDVRGDTVSVWGGDRADFDELRLLPPRTHWSQHALTIPPILVIESISVGHEVMDRRTKRRWYAELGVRHYWIVDGLRHTLDCWLLNGNQYRDGGEGSDVDVVRPAGRRVGRLT